MIQTNYDQIMEMLKNKELHYYNFYNNDISPATQRSTNWYINHQNDTINTLQNLHCIYLDIECYNFNQDMTTEIIDNGTNPINIVTIYDDETETIHTFLLLFNNERDNNIAAFGLTPDILNDANKYTKFIIDKEKYFLQELKNREYINNEFIGDIKELNLHIYFDEKQLLTELWLTIHTYDPELLTSWNGDNFDYWYLYNRCKLLFGEENVENIMSKFGKLYIRDKRVQFAEYTVTDLLYFYKARDEGGMGYGYKESTYTLDAVSSKQLKLKKVQYIDKGMNIDEFFIKNPIEATLYNIVDVILIVGLSNKLQFFTLHNQIRRAMVCPFQMSIIGPAAYYDAFIYYQLKKLNKFIRCYIINESSISFPIEYIEKFGVLKNAINNKNDLLPVKLTSKDINGITKKYPGAYVKQPYPEIVVDDTMIIDLDATSMYPSNINQGNISFDTYIARVIPPQCYSTIKVLKQFLGTNSQYPPVLANNVKKYVLDYTNSKSLTNKTDFIQHAYYTVLALFDKLLISGYTFDEICNPENTEQCLLLKNILIPLLDAIFLIHPESETYNTFVYDYLYLGMDNAKELFDNIPKLKEKYKDEIWVIKDPGESSTNIISMSIDEIKKYIMDHTITLSGCMFEKHDVKKGLFIDTLHDFYKLRKQHKNKRNEYEEGTTLYKFEDNNQLVFKRLMNTCYGLYGLTSFRYSDSWLARSITNNSQHAIKCAIYFAENFLNQLYSG